MRIHHLALRVADIERSAAFYADLLGLPVLRRNLEGTRPRSLWLGVGEAVLMLELRLCGDGPTSGSGHVLALAIDDLPAWEARLHEAGIPVDARTQDTLYVRDPDGHRVGLSRHPLP